MNTSHRHPPAVATAASRATFAVSRMRRSRVLRACALLAFVEYGALVVIAIFGGIGRGPAWPRGSYFPLAGWLAMCSLGSWFFLFAWFPFLQTLQDQEKGTTEPGALTLSRVLETIAIGCVAAVHGMLALILVQAV